MNEITGPSRIEAMRRAKCYLRAWKCLKCINPVVGGAVFGYSFTAVLSDAPQGGVVFGFIHPVIVAVAGLVLLSDLPWRKRAEEG